MDLFNTQSHRRFIYKLLSVSAPFSPLIAMTVSNFSLTKAQLLQLKEICLLGVQTYLQFPYKSLPICSFPPIPPTCWSGPPSPDLKELYSH